MAEHVVPETTPDKQVIVGVLHTPDAFAQYGAGQGPKDLDIPKLNQSEIDRRDAERFRKLQALLEKSYQSGYLEADAVDGYCSMISAWRNVRVIKAELYWQEKSDGAIDLGAALDAITLETINPQNQETK